MQLLMAAFLAILANLNCDTLHSMHCMAEHFSSFAIGHKGLRANAVPILMPDPRPQIAEGWKARSTCEASDKLLEAHRWGFGRKVRRVGVWQCLYCQRIDEL